MIDFQYEDRRAVENQYRSMRLDLERRKAVGVVGPGCLCAPSSIAAVAGFLDPQTRADEVRVIRARMGLPVGLGMRRGLEQRPPANGSIERLRDPDG